MLCWLASGEHEAVQVVTLQSVSSVVQSQNPASPQGNEGKPVETLSPALLSGGQNAFLAGIWRT